MSVLSVGMEMVVHTDIAWWIFLNSDYSAGDSILPVYRKCGRR